MIRERAPAILGRRPLLMAALVAAVCVISARYFGSFAGVAAMVLGGLGMVLGGWRVGLTWAATGLVAASGFLLREKSRAESEAVLIGSAGTVVEARLTEDAGHWGDSWSAPAVIRRGPRAGAKIWWQGAGEPPVSGAVVRASGNFEPLPVPRNPGEFDKGKWLKNQGTAAVFQAFAIGGEVEIGRLARLGGRVRRGFRDAVTFGLPADSQEARVILAMVVGERPTDADELVDAFRHSGTLHVFSVSGLHVGLVGGIGWVLLRGIRVPRRRAVAVLLVLIFGYAWITGNGPPAVRSAWMMAVFLGAFVFRRQPDLLNALGAVLLGAMLWDGRLLFNPGVQLSYGVVAAISVGTAWSSKVFGRLAARELYLPQGMMNWRQVAWLKARRWVAGSLSVSSAAWLGSAPLSAVHFGLVTPISIVSSVLLIPLVGLLLGIAVLAAAAYPVAPKISAAANRINGGLANFSVYLAETFAAVPGGHFLTKGTHGPFLLVYDLKGGAGAACFSAGNDGAVLIDCGDAFGFSQRLAPSLRELGVYPDSVVLTHPDGGHLGGGRAVWDSLPVKQVLLPVELSRSPAFRAWGEEAPAAGVARKLPREGEILPLPGEARLEILHVPDPRAQSALADDRVMVLRMHWNGWKLLFMSDAGVQTELELLSSGKDLSADVIIAGRHRRDPGLESGFIEAVRPRAIIASNARFPVAERLPPRQVEYWKSQGIEILDQERTGGVTVRLGKAGELLIEGFVDGSQVRFTRP